MVPSDLPAWQAAQLLWPKVLSQRCHQALGVGNLPALEPVPFLSSPWLVCEPHKDRDYDT